MAHGKQKRAQIDLVIRYMKPTSAACPTLVPPLWRSCRWTDGVPRSAILPYRAVCRPTIPHAMQAGTRCAVPCNRGPPRGRYEINGQASRRVVSERCDEP